MYPRLIGLSQHSASRLPSIPCNTQQGRLALLEIQDSASRIKASERLGTGFAPKPAAARHQDVTWRTHPRGHPEP